MNLPAVSVITACHNYGQWLAKAMLSVDAEGYIGPKCQVVIDDGSTDNTWRVLTTLAGVKGEEYDNPYSGRVGKVPVVAIRLKDAGGPSRARNVGMKLVWNQTDLFAPLDADDEMRVGKITKSVAKYMEDPTHIVGVYTDYDTVNQQTGVVLREFKPPYNRDVLISMRDNPIHSACIFPRWVVEKAGMYDEELRVTEDLDRWCAYSDFGIFLHIPESLMKVRVGGHNSSSTVQKELWNKCWSLVAAKIASRHAHNNHT